MNHNKGIAPTIIAIIIATIIAGGGVAYKVTNKDKKVNNNPPQTTNNTNQNDPNIVGGDRDEHGCIGSAGYSWCGVKNKCLRTWEEKCENTPSTIDTSNWKTYKNDKYGFEVKYPPETEIIENVRTNGMVVYFSLTNLSINFSLLDRRVLKDSACNDWPRGVRLSQVRINGINFTRGDFDTLYVETKSVPRDVAYCAINGETLISIKESAMGLSSTILDNMISTFKFTK